jgi:hypothetical protein
MMMPQAWQQWQKQLILITTMINAKQKHDVMTADISMLLFKQMLMRRFKLRVSASLWRFKDLSWICY